MPGEYPVKHLSITPEAEEMDPDTNVEEQNDKM
jgi:hypothetical protein